MTRVILAGVLGSGSSGFAETITNRADVVAARIPSAETGWEGDHLTGTWGGFRTKLVEQGIHFYAGYAGEVLGNVSGGLRRGAIFEGLLELGLDLDTERLGLWRGGTVHVSSLYPHGSSLSRRYTGDLLAVSNIDAHDSFRLYELWYEQRFFDETLSLRAGQLVADEEFAGTDAGSLFLNSAFGWPAFISGNTLNTGPAFFVAAPGVRLRYDRERVFIQTGIFDGDPFDSPVGDPRVNASGTRIHLGSRQGLFAIAEAGWRLNAGENATGLPGEYKIGAWLHTGDFSSNFRDRSGEPWIVTGLEPREHSKTYGAYMAAQQMLWREEGEQGLYGFFRAGVSPRDRSLFEFVLDGGVALRGLIPSRDEDVLGVGFAYARLSRDIRRLERADAAVNQTRYAGWSDHESVIEAFYSVHLKEWWTVQPDFQWVFNPGGSSAVSDAVVIGLRTTIIF